MTGKTIAVTGIFPNMTRKEVEEKIRGAGGEISGTVSVNTDWLVVGEKPGSKLQRAKELGIRIICAIDFLDMIE